MIRAKSIVVAVAEALKISRVFPLAPACAVRAPAGRSSVWTRGGEISIGKLGEERLVVRKTSAVGCSAVSVEFLGRLLVESPRPRDARDFELELVGDTWRGRELA